MEKVGVIEALTSAIGEALNEVGGLRFTRLTANHALGATTANVETTYGWPTSGKFIVQGTLYAYTGKTPLTLTGISYVVAGVVVNGLRTDLRVATPVIDFSRTFSALDRTVARLFVGYAEGEDLSIIGRNLGVDRPVGLEDDETFRAVVQALAYLPRGTMYGLETALTAFFGEGNFEVWENFPLYRNTVFVQITGGYFLATTYVGQAYLTAQELQPLDTGTKVVELDASHAPLCVQGVRLAPEESALDLTAQKPSTPTEVRYTGDAGVPVWTFAGTNEVTDVLLAATDGGITRMRDTVIANVAAYYHTARIRPESVAHVELHLRAITLPSTTDGRQFMLHLCDGERDVAIALFDVDGTHAKVGFAHPTTGALIGTGLTFLKADYVTIALHKAGTGEMELRVGGASVEFAARSSFLVSTANEFRFGMQSTTLAATTDVYLKSVAFTARTVTDFWNLRGTGGATLATATFDTNSAALVAGDVGKHFRTFDAPTNKNNGQWVVATVPTSDNVTLTAPTRQLAILESAHPARVRIASDDLAFKYPDDVGKLLDIMGAQTAPNPGTYVIATVLDGDGNPYTGTAENFSDTVEVTGSPGFVTETEIPWKLVPNFSVEAGVSWELSDAGTQAGTTLTLRANPPLTIPLGYVVIVEVVYSVVLSAQLLAGVEIANDGDDYFPFYLPSDPLGPFSSFIDELTVAGVIPEVSL